MMGNVNDLQSTTRKYRIALLGIYHETNTFIETPTKLDDFKGGYWLEGDAIRKEYEGAHHEISGVIEAIDAAKDMELIPVFYASATPGGLIDRHGYEFVLSAMMDAFDLVMPVDGCLVVPHGAGVADGYPDMDGHWLSVLREKIGSAVVVTGTLDPHANVSEEMIDATDMLIAYATNPHVDQRETGRQAASMMIETLRGNIRPVQRLVQLPLSISIEQQYTSGEPCKSLYAYVADLRTKHQLLSASVLLGFPYADVPEMGSAFIIVADGKSAPSAGTMLNSVGEDLTGYILGHREDFNGKKNDIYAFRDQLGRLAKPILVLDMGDNVGGGAPGNSTHLLAFLEREHFANSFVCIDDPQAVKLASANSCGDSFRLAFGDNFTKYVSDVTLLLTSDGIFEEDTPKHGGFVHYDMGPTVIVGTAGGNTVMLTSKRTPPYSLQQMKSFGLDPTSFEIIIAKGVNAPIAAYAPVCASVIQVDTPGVTQADMTLFEYKNRRKPMFPFET